MSVLIAWQRGADSTHHAVGSIVSLTVASLPAFGPWAVGTPAERGPSLESIYRVFLTVDLCEGKKIV